MSRKIKVAIDIRDLRIAKTGAKTYLEEICKELKKGHPGFTFYFIDTWLPVYRGNSKFGKALEHLRFFIWKQMTLPIVCFFKNCDILFCSDYFLPCIKLNFKTVVVFHDAFFWEYPGQYNRLWLLLLQTFGVTAAKKADAVITMTEYSKSRILKYVDLQVDKIHTIPLAPKSSVQSVSETGLSDDSADNNLSKKYILHIGVFEKRKNLTMLVKAFHLLLKDGFEDYLLILVGSNISKKDIDDYDNILALIKTLDLQNKVILPGYISDQELASYYQHAHLYAFVSINEGFGIPILEAFQNQLPVLIADNSCLPEVGGNAVITCNPFDEMDIKEKIKSILINPSLQKELIEKGKERLALFSWQRTASELLDVFKKLKS